MTEAQEEYVADNLEQILSNLDDETLIAEMKRRGFTTSKKRFDEPFCVKGSLKDKIIEKVEAIETKDSAGNSKGTGCFWR